MNRIKIVVYSLLLLSLVGCRGQREIVREVPVYLKDTVREVHSDTVRHNDTTIIEHNTVVQMADSATLSMLEAMGLKLDRSKDYILVLQKELEQRISEIESIKSDSTYTHNEKPVTVSETETVMVEKPLGWWKKTFMWTGVIALLSLLALTVWKTRGWWLKIFIR